MQINDISYVLKELLQDNKKTAIESFPAEKHRYPLFAQKWCLPDICPGKIK
jgi:hypothetical protein